MSFGVRERGTFWGVVAVKAGADACMAHGVKFAMLAGNELHFEVGRRWSLR